MAPWLPLLQVLSYYVPQCRYLMQPFEIAWNKHLDNELSRHRNIQSRRQVRLYYPDVLVGGFNCCQNTQSVGVEKNSMSFDRHHGYKNRSRQPVGFVHITLDYHWIHGNPADSWGGVGRTELQPWEEIYVSDLSEKPPLSGGGSRSSNRTDWGKYW